MKSLEFSVADGGKGVTEILGDPEMGAVSFLVERTTYRRVKGTLTPATEVLQAEGCIHPGTAEMLQLVPEEERKEEFIAVYTSFLLSDGENQDGLVFRAADRIMYDGSSWRVVRVRYWREFRYVQALAVKIGDEDGA